MTRLAGSARALVIAALGVSAAAAPGPVSAAVGRGVAHPASWTGPGPCDASPAMVRLGAAPLSARASFQGVYACGPRPGPNWTEPGVPSQIALYGDWQGFQCSELSSRFFFLTYGLYAAGDGSWIAEDAHARHPADVQLVENHKGALPQVGDIVSLSTGRWGHTYVVTGAANVDAIHGSEDITILEQNYSPNGVRTVKVRDWSVEDPGFRVLRWAHALKDPWSGAGVAPAPGAQLALSSVGATSATLDWSAWPSPTGAHEFDVYRDDRYVASVPMGTTRFVDSGLAASSTHTYRIVAQGGTLDAPISSPSVQVSTTDGAIPARTPDASFVATPDGAVYRIAGGSPLRVYDWAPFGGAQPAAAIPWASFRALPSAPADGTFLRIARTQVTYIVAGGAPMFVSDWAPYGGPRPAIEVNAGDIAAMQAAPGDGTFLRDARTSAEFIIAGGAPLAVDDSASYGAHWAVPVNGDTIAEMRQTPASGTLIRDISSAAGYVVAGGSPLRVSDWAVYGDAPSVVPVNASTIARMQRSPWDGTYLEGAATHDVYVVAGGAALRIVDWAPFGGAQPAVLASDAAIAAMPVMPADGTFLQAAGSSTAYAVAGGVVTPINDWGLYGGPQSAVAVSPVSIAALPEAPWRDSHAGAGRLPARPS